MSSRRSIYFKSIIVLLAYYITSCHIYAQEFKILDISTEEYPVISARYVLTNSYNEKVTNLTKEEILLQENNVDREIIYLKNSKIREMPLSILLVFDISGSMINKRMDIAKEAARVLINEVELVTSEIAISTFNHSAFLNCDFTHDAERLKNAIDAIKPIGSTSYEEAFLADLTGAVEIAKQGMFKKIIIFMTDGLGDAKSNDIIKQAKKEDITIYTAAIELDMPPVLKKVAKESGGYFFEQINSPEESKKIYKNLYRDIAAPEYGVMEWLASEDCEDIHDVNFSARGLQTQHSFELPRNSIDGLVVMPPSFFLRSQKKDSTVTRFMRLTSPSKPITITNIFSTNSDIIKVEVPEFPLELGPGQSHQLKVEYSLKETTDSEHQIKIYTENCLERSNISIQYGTPGKIEVITPAKGDVYGAGMDTVIQWRGVSKNLPVALYYRYGDMNWQKITDASGLEYHWETPFDTSSSYKVMAKPADANDFNKRFDLPEQLRDTRILDVSYDGSMIVTTDVVGMINVWQIETQKVVSKFQNLGIKFIYFSQDNLSLIAYNTYTLSVRSVFSNSQEISIYKDQGKIFAAHPTLYGNEFLLPAEVMSNNSTSTSIKELISTESFSVEHDENAPLFAAFCAYAPYVLWMNRDYSLDLYKTSTGKSKRITRKGQVVLGAKIGPNGKYIYIEDSRWRGIIESNRGKPILGLNKDSYIRFSPDGNHLLTLDSIGKLSLWDLNESERLIRFSHTRFFNFSYNGKILYYVNGNVLTLYNIEKKSIVHRINFEEIKDISIAPNGSDFLIVSKGEAAIYDCATGNLKAKVINRSSPVSKAVYAGNNKIVTINQDRSISVWESTLLTEAGTSGAFSIVSPLPDVIPEYDLGTETVGLKKEVVLENFITNNTQFPIRILQFEWENYPDEFELISNPPPFTLEPGEAKNIEIRFAPSQAVVFPNSISVVTPGGNITSKITGTGLNRKYEIPNKIIDFGKIKWNTYKDTTVAIVKNVSDENIRIRQVKNTGPDTEQFNLLKQISEVELTPGEALVVNLKYSAKNKGRASGGLTINVENKDVFVQLFGEGTGLRGTRIIGKTIDQDSLALQANLICTNLEYEKEVYNELSDSPGNFSFWLNADMSYILYAEKDGYISGSENIDLTQPFTQDTTTVTIVLSKIEQGNLFRLNGVFFEFAKADLIPASKTDLDRVLELLRKNKELNLEVHGHTDAVGKNESNLSLSKNRANAVKRYLTVNGISAERITIQFFGETKPIATNETEEGRQLNRRVEFLITE